MMNTNTHLRYYIYARKSTESEDRQVRSIGDQLAEIRDLAQKEGLRIVDVLTESQSAKTPGRPVFNDMLARIEKGEADGILSWHPDRLARNSLDGGKLIWLVDTGTIKDLRFCTYRFDPSAQGKFMLSIMFSQSKYYVDNLSENIKRGIRQKLKAGIWPQKAPLGYINDRQARIIVPDPVRAPLIRELFERYATGQYSLAALRDSMEGSGLVGTHGSLAISNIQYILNNPVYYGLIDFKGECYEGKHMPLVTKKLYDACQAVMQQRLKPKPSSLKPYLYRGVFHCGECGCLITTETHKGHDYLRCTKRKGPCSQRYVRAEAVAEQVAAAVKTLVLPAEDADWLLAALEQEQAADSRSHENTTAGVREQVVAVDRKMDRLTTAYLDAAVSMEEYRSAKKSLIQKKHDLEDQFIELEKSRSDWFEPAKHFILSAKSAQTVARSDAPPKHLELLRKAGSNRLLTNKRVTWQPRGAWELVVNAGRFAQQLVAASHDAATLVGEPDQHRLKRSLLVEVRQFFKANPTWE